MRKVLDIQYPINPSREVSKAAAELREAAVLLDHAYNRFRAIEHEALMSLDEKKPRVPRTVLATIRSRCSELAQLIHVPSGLLADARGPIDNFSAWLSRR